MIRIVMIVGAGCLLVGSAALAQQVPLPRPAPLPKERLATAPRQKPVDSSKPLGQTSQDGSPGSLLSWLPKPPALFGEDKSFNEHQRSLVDRASLYLTNIRTLSGTFVQIAPNGLFTTGRIYVEKPGRARFEYDPPSTTVLIADGQSVAVFDRRLSTRDTYPLSQTPLRILVSERVDLLRDTNVVDVASDEKVVTITMEEQFLLAGKYRLDLIFGIKDMALRQWAITDPHGGTTSVALHNLDTKRRLGHELFRIDDGPQIK